ncbi:MAG: hypothetical protein K6G90_03565 [Clostridia bacterium]|nr:hypothetical protein [Clostridia bacterium]
MELNDLLFPAPYAVKDGSLGYMKSEKGGETGGILAHHRPALRSLCAGAYDHKERTRYEP